MASGPRPLAKAPFPPSAAMDEWVLLVRQQPERGRSCGFGSKMNRRPIDPPIVLQLGKRRPVMTRTSTHSNQHQGDDPRNIVTNLDRLGDVSSFVVTVTLFSEDGLQDNSLVLMQNLSSSSNISSANSSTSNATAVVGSNNARSTKNSLIGASNNQQEPHPLEATTANNVTLSDSIRDHGENDIPFPPPYPPQPQLVTNNPLTGNKGHPRQFATSTPTSASPSFSSPSYTTTNNTQSSSLSFSSSSDGHSSGGGGGGGAGGAGGQQRHSSTSRPNPLVVQATTSSSSYKQHCRNPSSFSLGQSPSSYSHTLGSSSNSSQVTSTSSLGTPTQVVLLASNSLSSSSPSIMANINNVNDPGIYQQQLHHHLHHKHERVYNSNEVHLQSAQPPNPLNTESHHYPHHSLSSSNTTETLSKSSSSACSSISLPSIQHLLPLKGGTTSNDIDGTNNNFNNNDVRRTSATLNSSADGSLPSFKLLGASDASISSLHLHISNHSSSSSTGSRREGGDSNESLASSNVGSFTSSSSNESTSSHLRYPLTFLPPPAAVAAATVVAVTETAASGPGGRTSDIQQLQYLQHLQQQQRNTPSTFFSYTPQSNNQESLFGSTLSECFLIKDMLESLPQHHQQLPGAREEANQVGGGDDDDDDHTTTTGDTSGNSVHVSSLSAVGAPLSSTVAAANTVATTTLQPSPPPPLPPPSLLQSSSSSSSSSTNMAPPPPLPSSSNTNNSSLLLQQQPQPIAASYKGAFFVFAHLCIRPEGRYRLKFLLYDLKSSMKTRTHSSPILFVLSEPFYSYTGREFPGLVPSSALSIHLGQQGIGLPLRYKFRRKRSATTVSSRGSSSGGGRRPGNSRDSLMLPGGSGGGGGTGGGSVSTGLAGGDEEEEEEEEEYIENIKIR